MTIPTIPVGLLTASKSENQLTEMQKSLSLTTLLAKANTKGFFVTLKTSNSQ